MRQVFMAISGYWWGCQDFYIQVYVYLTQSSVSTQVLGQQKMTLLIMNLQNISFNPLPVSSCLNKTLSLNPIPFWSNQKGNFPVLIIPFLLAAYLPQIIAKMTNTLGPHLETDFVWLTQVSEALKYLSSEGWTCWYDRQNFPFFLPFIIILLDALINTYLCSRKKQRWS